jgi:hypothetical protein
VGTHGVGGEKDGKGGGIKSGPHSHVVGMNERFKGRCMQKNIIRRREYG